MTDTDQDCPQWPGGTSNCYLHDPNWFAFVAGGSIVNLTIEIANCDINSGVQFNAYDGEPVCSGACVEGLNVVAGNCNNPMNAGTHNFTFSTIPGDTYYLVFDGNQGDLCDISITIDDGGQQPPAGNPDDPSLIFLVPPFNGPDTICQGAEDVEVSIPGLPFGATQLRWFINDAEVTETSIGVTSFMIPDSILTSPGPIEVCVEAFNDCTTSDNMGCREYIVAPIPQVTEKYTVCEGALFQWDNGPVNTSGITEDVTITQSATRQDQYGCPYMANLELTVLSENNENPDQVETAICYGSTYSHPSGYTNSGAGAVDQEFISTDADGCDNYWNFNISVVGGEFFVLPPTGCIGDSTLTLEAGYTEIYPNTTIPLSDPELNVTYQWLINGTDSVGTDNDTFIVDQETIEQHPFGHYNVEVTLDHPLLDAPCTFITNPVLIEHRDTLSTMLVEVTGTEQGEQNGSIEIDVSGGTPPYDFEWYLDGELVSTAEDPADLAGGMYTLELTDEYGCTSTLGPIEVPFEVATIDPSDAVHLTYFPNPARDRLHLESSEIIQRITVYSMQNKRLIDRMEINRKDPSLSISELPVGIYYLKVQWSGGKRHIEKFVKQ